MALLLINFAFALRLYHHGAMLDAVPGIGTGLHTILVYAQRMLGLLVGSMFVYLVILGRRA